MFMKSMERNDLAMMKVTLPNGASIEGSIDQVRAVMRAMGIFVEDGLHYNSSTKGNILIANMDSQHIKNAIRKLYTAEVEKLNTKLPNSQFVALIRNGIGTTNVTLLGLLKELVKRETLERK